MATAGGPVDLLEHRTGYGTRQLWRRVALAVVGLLALSVTGVLADRRLRSHEFDEILAGCLVGEADSAYAERTVIGMVDYAAPLLQRADASPELKAGMAARVRATASAAADSLAPGRSTLAALTILPWHGPQLDARDACSGYLSQADHRLRRVADDLSALDLPTDYLQNRQRAARAALVAAAVDPAATRAASTIFADIP